MSYESLELSPGFFDPQLAVSDDEDPIIPLIVDIEKSKKGVAIFNDENTIENKTIENKTIIEDKNMIAKNEIDDVLIFMFTVQKGCGCTGGWKRTARY